MSYFKDSNKVGGDIGKRLLRSLYRNNEDIIIISDYLSLISNDKLWMGNKAYLSCIELLLYFILIFFVYLVFKQLLILSFFLFSSLPQILV